MAGYAADVNECCGRTLFLRVSRTRAGHMLLLIPKEEHKKEKRVKNACRRGRGRGRNHGTYRV